MIQFNFNLFIHSIIYKTIHSIENYKTKQFANIEYYKNNTIQFADNNNNENEKENLNKAMWLCGDKSPLKHTIMQRQSITRNKQNITKRDKTYNVSEDSINLNNYTYLDKRYFFRDLLNKERLFK